MPIQRRLFPLHIVAVSPVAAGTARLKVEGEGDDGHPYFIKRVADGPYVPANELICSALASDVGLVVPDFAVGILNDDQEAFCSRCEGGLQSAQEWMTKILTAPPLPAGVISALSRWFAFDLFTNNPDRHFNNFLYREDRGISSLFGFDFSEALFAEPWPPAANLNPGCNTLKVRRLLAGKGVPLDHDQAVLVLDRIDGLDVDWVQESMPALPDNWLPVVERNALDDWWRNDRHARVDYIKQEIGNGRYN